MDFKKYFSLLKKSNPKSAIDDVAESIPAPSTLPQNLMSQAPDELLENAPFPSFDPAAMSQIDNLVAKRQMNPLTKGALTAGGLGAGALGLSMLDDEQAAPAAEIPLSGSQALSDEKAKELPKQAAPAVQGEKPFKAIDLASNLKDSYGPDTEQARAESPDYMSLLRSAQQGQNDNNLTNNLLKAGQTIGSALAYNKPDYSVADSLNQQAGQGVQNVLQQMKSQNDQTELNDNKTLRDPTSDVSKAFRATLAKLGIPYTEKTTAWDAKAMGINPQNLLMQDRALEKQMKMLEAKGRKETDSFVTGAQKTLLKPYKEYQKVATAKASLDGYLKGEPSGPKDVAILYDFIKGLDPESAVKEGEIELGKSAMSLFEQYGLKARKFTNSDLLSPKFRAAINDIMKAKEIQARANYEEIAQPFKLHGASRGLEEADYGKFDYLSAADSKKTSGQQQEQVPAAQQLVERKTKDGKIALFDPTTKQFVKYKE